MKKLLQILYILLGLLFVASCEKQGSETDPLDDRTKEDLSVILQEMNNMASTLNDLKKTNPNDYVEKFTSEAMFSRHSPCDSILDESSVGDTLLLSFWQKGQLVPLCVISDSVKKMIDSLMPYDEIKTYLASFSLHMERVVEDDTEYRTSTRNITFSHQGDTILNVTSTGKGAISVDSFTIALQNEIFEVSVNTQLRELLKINYSVDLKIAVEGRSYYLPVFLSLQNILSKKEIEIKNAQGKVVGTLILYPNGLVEVYSRENERIDFPSDEIGTDIGTEMGINIE